MNILIGNSIALIAATLMVIANYVKEKKTIIKTQTLQITLFALLYFKHYIYSLGKYKFLQLLFSHQAKQNIYHQVE